MGKGPLTLILNYRKTSTFALNVIAGALSTQDCTRDVEVRFAKRWDTLIASVEGALGRGARAVVAWSLYSAQLGEVTRDLARVRRELNDERVIHLAGGVHATAEPEQTLRAGFDYVAVGEGERVIIEFIDRLRRDQDVGVVRGIASLREGRLVRNGRGEIVDLNDFPPFAIAQRRLGPIEITRGCVYGCKFCQTPFMNKARFRHRTVENICHYVRLMREQNVRDYRFITPTALSYGSPDEQPRLDGIEDLLASVRNIIGKDRRLFYGTFPSELRPEHVTRRSLALLKRYVDNDNLIIGGQSGSPRVLAASHRGHDVEAIERAVRLSREAGFIPNVDFLFGLPGEGPADARASLALARKLVDLGARVHAHTFMPLPGTPYRDAGAGKISADVQRSLDRLTARGRLYGQWRRQMRLARELAERRQQSA